MTLTASYDPPVPFPGDDVTLVTVSQLGTLTEWTLTDAPESSKLALAKLVDFAAVIRPDVAGTFALTATDWDRNYTAPRFSLDDEATPTMVSVGTGSLSVYVAESLTRTIGVAPGTVDMVAVVQNDTAIGVMLVGPRTDLAELVTQQESVRLALSACSGVTSANLDATLMVKTIDLKAKYEAHRILTAGTVHQLADTTNVVTRTNTPTTTTQAIGDLNELRALLAEHMVDASGDVAYHFSADTTNVIIAGSASDVASGHTLADDLWRVFEAHRVFTPAHTNPDTTNALTAQLPLAALQTAIIRQTVALAGQVTPGDQPATTTLVSAHGFRVG